MMKITKKYLTKTLILAVLLLSGCGGMNMTGGYIDPGFVHQSIRDGRMAVVGVVSSVQDLTIKERSDYASVLRTNFLEYRKDYSVSPSGDLVNKIGKEGYSQIMDNYKETGALATEHIQKIKEAMGVKYAVIARIENDKTTNEPRRRSMSYAGKMEAPASRTMTVSMNIYDLDNARSVFSGNMTSSDNETELHDEYIPRNDFASGLAGIINAAKGRTVAAPPTEDELYPYPFVDPRSILDSVFRKFAWDLPKK